jgi:hypothetical protein
MTDDSYHTLPVPEDSDEQLDEFRGLVRAAFEQAHRSGKRDWEEMTSAVLKNRLLIISEGEFSQARYGSPSFLHLVRRVPDLLEFVTDDPPFRLRIKLPATEHGNVAPADESQAKLVSDDAFTALLKGDLRRVRIREDLWHAIIDYGSGNVYVLDPDTGLARPRTNIDIALPQLPTASREEVSSWRSEFTESLEPSVRARFTDELTTWAESGGRQSELPGSIRGQWAEFLKRKVIHILLAWFADQEILPPKDMVFATEGHTRPSSPAIEEVVETRQLRNLIINAVRAMTYEELSHVSLPASVVLRISRRPGRDD